MIVGGVISERVKLKMRTMSGWLSLKCLIGVVFLSLAGCGASDKKTGDADSANQGLEGKPIDVSQLTKLDSERVCRAAIGQVIGHDPQLVSVVKHSSGIVVVKYVRDEDRSIWKYDCQINGDAVIYRTIDAFGRKSGPGPWRNRAEDPEINFKITDKQLAIYLRYQDGSSSGKAYWLSWFD